MAPVLDDLDLVKTAAVEAGALAMRHFRNDPQVWLKDGNSPVSEADIAVDAFLKDALLGARPSYGWLSEEMQEDKVHGFEADRFFVVDPIDGTRAYLRGEETWCVSIAIIENARPVAGVIAAPALGEVFEVTADSPARLNGAVCSVTRPDANDPLRLAIPESMRKQLDAAGGETIMAQKAIPSLAYRLALVASGRLDGTVIRPRANDWDIAAADLLLERAGGLLCDRDGDPALYRSQGRRHGLLVAGSREIMARVRRLSTAIAD